VIVSAIPGQYLKPGSIEPGFFLADVVASAHEFAATGLFFARLYRVFNARATSI